MRDVQTTAAPAGAGASAETAACAGEAAPAAPPVLGPILHFRGAEGDVVRLSASLALPEGAPPPPLRLDAAAPAPERIGALGGAAFWSWTFEARRGKAAGYELGGVRRPIALLPPGGALRLAFASCNGGEDEEAAARAPGGRDAMWAHLARRHEAAPFHLLAMGGDQIYADGLWRLPSMRAWGRMGRRARLRAPFTDAMRRELEAHYIATYASVLGARDVGGVLAQVPSVMMWDDHDIVDGWGSRAPAWQASPVARGLFAVARRAFGLVQLGCDPDRPPPGFAAPDGAHLGWSGAYGPARILAPDLRSERTRSRVMGPRGRADLDRALAEAREPHLLVVSSVPLVNADLSALERVVAPLTPLADLYQDDLRDQWMSHRHREEWRAVMERLLTVAEGGARVTALSGEIHLGGHGTASRIGGAGRDAGAPRGGDPTLHAPVPDGAAPGGPDRAAAADRAAAVVEQLIASGIAHPPPPRAMARLFDRLTRRPWRRAGLRLAMHPVAPDGRRYVAERNWLEVEAHPDGRLDATLHAEEAGPLPLRGGAG